MLDLFTNDHLMDNYLSERPLDTLIDNVRYTFAELDGPAGALIFTPGRYQAIVHNGPTFSSDLAYTTFDHASRFLLWDPHPHDTQHNRALVIGLANFDDVKEELFRAHDGRLPAFNTAMKGAAFFYGVRGSTHNPPLDLKALSDQIPDA